MDRDFQVAGEFNSHNPYGALQEMFPDCTIRTRKGSMSEYQIIDKGEVVFIAELND